MMTILFVIMLLAISFLCGFGFAMWGVKYKMMQIQEGYNHNGLRWTLLWNELIK